MTSTHPDSGKKPDDALAEFASDTGLSSTEPGPSDEIAQAIAEDSDASDSLDALTAVADAGAVIDEAATLNEIAEAAASSAEAHKPEPPSGPHTDDAGRLDEDVLCRVCGYNLRGIDPQGVCPECGTAAGLSLVGDLLKYADPRWVRRVARGSGWVIASVLLVITVVVGLMGISVAVRYEMLHVRWLGIAMLLLLLPLTALLRGYWLFTTKEPVKNRRGSVLRVFARYSTLLWVLSGLALWVYIAAAAMGFVERVPAVAALIVLGSTLLSFIATILVMAWGWRLATRIPDKKLALTTLLVMAGLISVQVISIFRNVHPALLMTWMVLGMVFAMWTVVLMLQFRGRLHNAAKNAERTWSRHAKRTKRA